MATGKTLGNAYPVLDNYNIFSYLDEIIAHTLEYLPMKSLHMCARVCKRWSHIVKRLKKTRHKPVWLMYDSGNETGSFVDEQIGSKLKEMSSEPRNGLVFCSTQLLENGVAVASRSSQGTSRRPRAAKMDKLEIVDYLRSVLPPQCHLVSIAADGIVGTCPDSGQVMEIESSKALSCLLLPKMDSVDIVNLSMNTAELCRSGDTEPDVERLLRTLGIPDSQVPRMVLLFCTENILYEEVDEDPAHLLLKHYGNVVIAGGLVDDLLPQPDDTAGTEPELYGVALCGGDNLQVASVLLDTNVRTQLEAETMIKKLKNTHIREENSIAFMFSCIGRGHTFYRAPNIEADAFRKVFRKTPLLGFFGNGEIGYDYLPDYSKGLSDRGYSVMTQLVSEDGGVETVTPEVHHSYTTVIAMLSWQPA